MDRSRICIILLLVLVWAHAAPAQVPGSLSLAEVDRVTYVFFEQKNWDGLIETGENALESSVDYYYLRVRMGIAYFEKENFHLAARHFEAALAMNASEAYVQEYLYYAYLNAGMKADASLLSADFSPELKVSTGTEKLKFTEEMDLAYNYTGLSDRSEAENFSAEVPPELDGVQFIPNWHHYFFLGLRHHFSPRLSFYHGYSNLQVSHLRYTQSLSQAVTEDDFRSQLNQYYAAAGMALPNRLTLSGGFHYVHYSFTNYTEVVGGPPGRPVVRNVPNKSTGNDVVVFASLYKRMEYITLGAAYYWGNLYGYAQNQADLRLIVYPFGNLNLYTTTTASYQNQDFKNGRLTNRFVIDQQVGMKTAEWLWLEVYGTFGELENFVMNDGLIVFNRLDVIKQRFGGRAIFIAKPKWTLTFDYAYLGNESQFISSPYTGTEYNQKAYQLHSLTVNSSWKF